MKLFSRTLSLVLCAALLLSLTGCAFGRKKAIDSDREKLMLLLDDLSENLHPGSAGSSLTNVRLTAKLITWAATTKLTKKEVASVVAEWLVDQLPEIREQFKEKLASIGSTYAKIVKDGAADLLEAAGVEADFSNLGSRMKDLVDTVLKSGGLDK